jgi:methyl-accepting chemotaxis protein
MACSKEVVEKGVTIATKAGDTLNSIQTASDTAAKRIQGIEKAAEKMNGASSQVSIAIKEIASVVEGNAAATEEMTASASEVSLSLKTVLKNTEMQTEAVKKLAEAANNSMHIATELDSAIFGFKNLRTKETSDKDIQKAA